jgi:hypothetical protein
LRQGNFVPVTAILHFKKITANSRFDRVRRIAQSRLLRVSQHGAVETSGQRSKGTALFQRIAEGGNRHAQRGSRNLNLGVTAGRRAADRGKSTNDSFASDQCDARTGDLAQRDGHGHQSGIRKDNVFDPLTAIMQRVANSQLQGR